MTNGTIIATKRNSNETLQIPVRYNIAAHKALQKNILAHREEIMKFYSWVAMAEKIYLQVENVNVAEAKFCYNVFSGHGDVESRLL